MNKPEDSDGLEPLDSFPAEIGDFSQDKLSDHGVVKSTPLSDFFGDRNAIRAGCIIGAIGLLGCYSLKYFVRRSNLRAKRLWLGASFSAMTYNCFMHDIEGRLMAKRIEESPLQSLYVFSTRCRLAMSGSRHESKPSDPKVVSEYWDGRAKLDLDDTLTKRMLNRVRGLWYLERWWIASFSMLAGSMTKQILKGRRITTTDLDLCVAHVATCISAERDTNTVPGRVIQRSAGFAITASTIGRLLSHRLWPSRMFSICGVSSGVIWLALEYLRLYYLYYEPYRIQDKPLVADIMKDVEGSDPRWFHRVLKLE